MMTATRRDYIKCLSTSCVICRHVTIFSENIQNEWRKLSQDVLINYIWHILHKLPYDRRRKAYRLSQTRKRSFQHTAFFLWSVNSPSSIDVHSCALYRNLINLLINLQLHPTSTLLIASLTILPRRFFTRSRPFVRIWSVARVRKKYGCFPV